MPFSTPFPLRPISQEEFAVIDYEVMRHAFASQNELGRLCDEVIYQHDLGLRLEGAGMGPIRTAVPITVFHQDFSKTFFLDLVVGDSAIYELKTVAQFVAEPPSPLRTVQWINLNHHQIHLVTLTKCLTK